MRLSLGMVKVLGKLRVCGMVWDEYQAREAESNLKVVLDLLPTYEYKALLKYLYKTDSHVDADYLKKIKKRGQDTSLFKNSS